MPLQLGEKVQLRITQNFSVVPHTQNYIRMH
uniref:Uncharacterized protein n=1 Tax=Anguilla anguilla TaxID=7936 RepID=A0A0E9RFA1_ANGAN